MKTSIIFLTLLLVACTPTPVKQPTPFKTGEAIKLYGCEKLKQEIEAYNRTHTDKKVADC